MSPVPNYPTHSIALALDPHRPPSCIMAPPEPPNIGSHSATATVLNADIETLAAAKDTLETIPVKAVFGSVIVILALVRVRVPFCLCLYSLLSNTIRTR